MKTENAIKKVEKFFGEKMNQNRNGQYYLNGFTFYSQSGRVNYVTVHGVNYDNVSKGLKSIGK